MQCRGTTDNEILLNRLGVGAGLCRAHAVTRQGLRSPWAPQTTECSRLGSLCGARVLHSGRVRTLGKGSARTLGPQTTESFSVATLCRARALQCLCTAICRGTLVRGLCPTDNGIQGFCMGCTHTKGNPEGKWIGACVCGGGGRSRRRRAPLAARRGDRDKRARENPMQSTKGYEEAPQDGEDYTLRRLRTNGRRTTR
jgi:hypothetical protein